MLVLENHWYTAATVDELGDVPIGRTICDRPMALFRDRSGAVVALNDRCPHRSAPLHLGRLEDGGLRCPYHGLLFDGSGLCIHSLHGGSGEGLRTPAYPTAEKWGFVWVWIGTKGRADPALIPNLWYMDHPEWNSFAGHMAELIPWQLMADNLLDLSHVPVTHANTIGASVGADADIPLFQRTETGIRNTLRSRNASCPPHIVRWGGFTSNINTFVIADWQPPNVIVLQVEIDNVGLVNPSEENRIGVRVGFPLTPATEGSFHHFFSWGRDFLLEDQEMDIFARLSMVAVQEEDLVVIRAQAALLEQAGHPNPARYIFDGGINAAHAILDTLLRDQELAKGNNYETPWYLRYQDAQVRSLVV